MRLYYVTTPEVAAEIRLHGFRDYGRFAGFDAHYRPVVVRGVWLADRPLWEDTAVDPRNPPPSLQVLQVNVPDDIAAKLESKGDEDFREWFVPEHVANLYVVPPTPR